MIFRLAARDLVKNRRKHRLILFVLSIGFLGPLATGALKESVDEYLETSSRKMLAADLALSLPRAFSDAEVKAVAENLRPKRVARETELITMARGRDVAALAEIKAVDAGFPAVGAFRFSDGLRADDARELNGETRVAWAEPEALAQLGLKVGDDVGIGRETFKIKASVSEGPGTSRTVGVAPRIYVGRKFIEATGLIAYGSQVSHRLYLLLPDGADVGVLVEEARALIHDPLLAARTPDDAVRGFERFFRFFNSYLTAISMIVFALSWMSAFYILQIFLGERLRGAAILMIHGAGRFAAGSVAVLQVVGLNLVAFVLSVILIAALIELVDRIFGARMPDGFRLGLSLSGVLGFAFVALVSALCFNLPFLRRLFGARLQELLDGSVLSQAKPSRLGGFVDHAPLFVLFVALSAWLTGSWTGALRIAGPLAGLAVLGWLAGRALFRAFFRAVRARQGMLRLIALALSRGRPGANLGLLALLVIALALNLVPHLLNSVVSEVEPLVGREVPALFLFNIPESGLEELQAFSRENKFEMRFVSPLILGRVVRVNGRPPKSDQLQRFPVRVSYREKRIPSETIVQGRELPLKYEAGRPVEISLEEGFAGRSHLALGDTIDFDIQGLALEAKVTSLRKVKWTSFNPNFFFMMQPGVLDEAPKTWVANVGFDGGAAEKVRLQYEISRRFPDLSVIDIGRTIERVLETARQVIGPVRAAAWFAIAMSIFILIAVVSHNLRLRKPEIEVDKLLGADAGLIRRLFAGEYALKGLFAWFVGAGGALGFAAFIARYFLDVPFRPSFATIGFSLLLLPAVGASIAWRVSDQLLREGRADVDG